MVPHRAVTAYLGWAVAAYELVRTQRCLSIPPRLRPHDIAVGPALAGGRVDLLPEGEGVDALWPRSARGGDRYDLEAHAGPTSARSSPGAPRP